MRRIWALSLTLTTLRVAHAEPNAIAPEDWIGLPVATVSLSAPRGGLPDESLVPLLRAHQGDPLTPDLVRADLGTLFRVGEFATVEADVEPWFIQLPDGSQGPAVNITYRVLPPPRVVKVRVQGQQELSARTIIDTSGLTRGQPFYPELDGPLTAERVRRTLVSRGYPHAVVEADPVSLGDDELEVWIRLYEGTPERITAINFTGAMPSELSAGEHRRMRRWARKQGLKLGAPLDRAAVQRAADEVRARLARVARGLGRPAYGYIDARVTPTVTVDDAGQARVTIPVELGPQLELMVTGMGWRGHKAAREALGIDERLRLTKGWLEDAPERLALSQRQRGYLDASASVTLNQPSIAERTLSVTVDRGARYAFPAFGKRFRFEGNEQVDEDTLSALLDQASPTVTRIGLYSPEALEEGVDAAEALYASKGYPDASVVVSELDVREPPGGALGALLSLWHGLRAQSPPKRVRATLSVTEGRLVRQGTVALQGWPEGITPGPWWQAAEARSGEAFSASALEQRARQGIEQLRQAGYLEADSRVRHSNTESDINSEITFNAGPQVLLRSVVTSGTRETRPAFVRRQLDLRLGEPLSSTTLAAARESLYQLGTFRSVNTTLLGDEAARDLVVALDERPRWALELGGGLSTDQGLRAFGRVTRRNLFGLAHRLGLYGLVALDYRSDAIGDWLPDWRTPELRAAISYTAPNFPLRSQDAVIDLLIREQTQQRSWRLARSGLGLVLDNRLSKNMDLQLSARIERRDLQEVDGGALVTGEAWDILRRQGDDTPWRIQESLGLVWLLDQRNDPVQPSKGSLFTLGGEWVPGTGVQGIADRPITRFVKADLRLSTYVPLKGFVLHIAAQGGAARGLGGSLVPLEDRFRLGGTGSLRGYTRQSVGPRNVVPRASVDWPVGIAPLTEYAVRANPDRWVPTGGDTVLLATTELFVPFPTLGLANWEGWAGTLFTDAGNTWLLTPGASASTELEPWRSLTPPVRVGSGAGLRIDTPIGPLQVDVAANLQRILAQGAQRELLATRWEEPNWRLHLALGRLW